MRSFGMCRPRPDANGIPGEGRFLFETEMPSHIAFHLRHVGKILREATVVVAVLAAVRLAFEIIISRRAFAISVGLAAMPDHLIHPPLFGFCRGIDGGVAVLADVLVGTLLTSVGLPGLMPLPWRQTVAVFVFAMVACLGVNDALKVALIKSQIRG